ncbi:MAG TPA: 2Fe-2S iron-sulfur cluster-binding protein, partial [Verrucomicrobiae bacterium]|nr:2Fe-2S iron-sulfur cluster-binding protein [Verrucomicrobiae bacterium]
MSDQIKIELLPVGTVFHVPRGTLLQDVLFAHGVEFPCGGRGLCKGCRIRIDQGNLDITEADLERLSSEELAKGWRLACKAVTTQALRIELAQWEATILGDDSAFPFAPQDGYGIAVDLGTTTIVAQLVDRQTGQVLGVRTALNAQAQHGADVMSRVEFAVAGQGRALLTELVRKQIGEMIRELLGPGHGPKDGGAARELRSIIVVGNSVMHHLFCGCDLEPLSRVPFEPQFPGLQAFSGTELGWDCAPAATVTFLPCLGGFVGSDIL